MSSPVVTSGYQRFIKLLEKWPVDKTKFKRDLGEHLRKQVKDLVNTSSSFSEHQTVQLNKQIESLEKLAANVHGNKYKRIRSATATGLTADECRQVLSSENLEYLNEERGIFQKSKD